MEMRRAADNEVHHKIVPQRHRGYRLEKNTFRIDKIKSVIAHLFLKVYIHVIILKRIMIYHCYHTDLYSYTFFLLILYYKVPLNIITNGTFIVVTNNMRKS